MSGQQSPGIHAGAAAHRGDGGQLSPKKQRKNATASTPRLRKRKSLPYGDTRQNAALPLAELIAALHREVTAYRQLVQAQVRCVNHVTALERHYAQDIVEEVGAELLASGKVLAKPRRRIARKIEGYAAQLPVALWVKSIRGAGMLNLGLLVGEAGADLAQFANPGKLWKRFGLHVMPDGTAARRFKDKDLAELAGYSPRRRSIAYVLGVCLIKGGSIYKGVYDERKVYELLRQPDMKPMYAHRRAMRYMVKRFIRDLWQQWRAQKTEVPSKSLLATPENTEGVIH